MTHNKPPSPDEILHARTASGGWNKETLAAWGIDWPPPKGWRKAFEDLWKSQNKASKPSERFYSSWQWAKARYNTLKKFGAVCMCCGATKNIVVDHIKPRSKYPELELDEDNLQVLCSLCNRGKSNDDETDFRQGINRDEALKKGPEIVEPSDQKRRERLKT